MTLSLTVLDSHYHSLALSITSLSTTYTYCHFKPTSLSLTHFQWITLNIHSITCIFTPAHFHLIMLLLTHSMTLPLTHTDTKSDIFFHKNKSLKLLVIRLNTSSLTDSMTFTRSQCHSLTFKLWTAHFHSVTHTFTQSFDPLTISLNRTHTLTKSITHILSFA